VRFFDDSMPCGCLERRWFTDERRLYFRNRHRNLRNRRWCFECRFRRRHLRNDWRFLDDSVRCGRLEQRWFADEWRYLRNTPRFLYDECWLRCGQWLGY
jgi:hypothetical protein